MLQIDFSVIKNGVVINFNQSYHLHSMNVGLINCDTPKG
jgi:hypothetical protein